MPLFPGSPSETLDATPFPQGPVSGEASRAAPSVFEGSEFFTDRLINVNQILYRIRSLTTPGTIVLAIYQVPGGGSGDAELLGYATRALTATGVFTDNLSTTITIVPGRFFVVIGKTSGEFSFSAFTSQSLTLMNGAGFVPAGLIPTTFTTATTATVTPPSTLVPSVASPSSGSIAPVIRLRSTVVPPDFSTIFGSDFDYQHIFQTSGNTITSGTFTQVNESAPGGVTGNYQPQIPAYAPALASQWGLETGNFSPGNPSWMFSSALSINTVFGSSVPFTMWFVFSPRALAAPQAITQRDAALVHGFGGTFSVLLNTSGLRVRVFDGAAKTTLASECPVTPGNLYAAKISLTGTTITCRVNGFTATPVACTYPTDMTDTWNLGSQSRPPTSPLSYFDGYYFAAYGVGRVNDYLQYRYAGASTDGGVPPVAATASDSTDNGALHVPVVTAFPSYPAEGDTVVLRGRMYTYSGTRWFMAGEPVSGFVPKTRQFVIGGKAFSPR